jgi:hypothetical protein
VLIRALMGTWASGMAQRIAVIERATGARYSRDNVEACSFAMLELGSSMSGVTRFAADATLLRLSAQLERCFPWADRVPPVSV